MMFTVTRCTAQRLDIRLSGSLDSQQMRLALDELSAQSVGIEHGVMLYDVIDFNLPSLAALGVELSRLPELFTLIQQFSYVAVLADQAWVRGASEIEGLFIPGLEIKAFDRAERDKAEAWLLSKHNQG